jgi:hypothetical protein
MRKDEMSTNTARKEEIMGITISIWVLPIASRINLFLRRSEFPVIGRRLV